SEQPPKPVKENNPGVQQSIDKSVNGRVTDEKGDALPGVSIMVKGSNQGTTTDNDGNYRLTVPEGSVFLIFSFVGYQSQEVAVDRTGIDIQLTADIKSLTEMVVVGYG
ncbi:carboxypeptidase-like regulatory domain-containing protein, partial [Escherichia coli]|uniref:carboxypeptidase-like regulatory domain-containing protein n=2 Tax=Pseudomonadati TaxID=3379134 RepID=UPI00211874C7